MAKSKTKKINRRFIMTEPIKFELVFENTDSLRLIADEKTVISMMGVQKDGDIFVHNGRIIKFNTVENLHLEIPKSVIDAGSTIFTDEDAGYGLESEESNWDRIQYPDICYIVLEGIDYSVFDKPGENPFSEFTHSQRFEIIKDKDGNDTAIAIDFSPESLALNRKEKIKHAL